MTVRLPFMIVIESWGSRIAVGVEPRQVDKPSRAFRMETEAFTFAEELRRLEGWPIEDRR
jgi:hypothetical protein